MPFYNFVQFLSLLAQLSEIDIKILMEYKDLLLKALSSLDEMKRFDTKEYMQLVNILEETFLDKLQVDESKKKEICKNIIKILKNHWKMFF
ncbi:hypothetical protein [Campylobacter lari]|uniref:Uncharacterized protein n=1 Tax=Campylobacter lari TaxID=201 RepID=A0A5L8WDS3_CAMLA|nr:hypothetical protein [Campylobacter lari]EAK9940342.1 hypothetical protein [Campylobacter lari]EAL4712056.1 hypothetical protein [Campylobacter lari]EGK8091437.1 hypothetical protein [Campylobacter lari]MCR2067981.1 hypothetical protein [Campylobacter lari subsp. concheus]MCR2083729.1 hypothetical protein [Campylobacter lari subsp. concheus]